MLCMGLMDSWQCPFVMSEGTYHRFTPGVTENSEDVWWEREPIELWYCSRPFRPFSNFQRLHVILVSNFGSRLSKRSINIHIFISSWSLFVNFRMAQPKSATLSIRFPRNGSWDPRRSNYPRDSHGWETMSEETYRERDQVARLAKKREALVVWKAERFHYANHSIRYLIFTIAHI